MTDTGNEQQHKKQIRIRVKYRPDATSNKFKVTEWILTAIPPKKGTKYYGTGYYLSAVPLKKNGRPDEDAAIHWDMRYAATKDIQVMADYWVRDYYGGSYTKKVQYFVA